MKYGLIYYHKTENAGDDILSYAARQFLPQVDYYIDRENMNLFVPEKKEYVAAVLNGWYLHYIYQFPPSPYLLPLFTGTHFSKDQWIFGDYSYLDGIATDYLKAHGPVGCRDVHTRDILKERGIDCYFSGCLTLTLQKFPDVAPAHTVVLTDVSDRIAGYVQSLIPDRQIIRMTHVLTPDETGADWPSREARVERYLKTYQAADLVITTRLHCALPSVALETPVILIGKYDEDFQNRLSDYAQCCSSCSEDDLLGGRADGAILRACGDSGPDTAQTVPAAGQTTAQLADRLSSCCRSFIRSVSENEPDISALPEPELYRELYIRRTDYMRRSMVELLTSRLQLSRQHIHDMEVMDQLLAATKKVLDMK